jgi:putative RecB family exonuclease
VPESRTPQHLSHSSRETLQRCARSYFLSRLTDAPKRPALWLAGGSAVHEATEFYDLQQVARGGKPKPWSEVTVRRLFNQLFDSQLASARATEPNENKWAKSSAEPIEVWRKNGVEFVRAYIDWRERSPWEIWTTPDGQPAIELDVSGFLPGCPVEIKGYIDRIFWDPVFKKHHVLDLKTGKKPPKNADQFGTYRALTAVKYGIDVDSGVPFMNRKGGLGKPFDLAEYAPEFVGDVFGEAWQEIQEYAHTGVWPATTGDCFICDVQASCAAVGGPLAAQFDPASPGHASNRPGF